MQHAELAAGLPRKMCAIVPVVVLTMVVCGVSMEYSPPGHEELRACSMNCTAFVMDMVRSVIYVRDKTLFSRKTP